MAAPSGPPSAELAGSEPRCQAAPDLSSGRKPGRTGKAQQPIRILGEGFRAAADELKLYVDSYPLSYNWIDEHTLEIPAAALDQLPLQTGQHHLRLADHELTAEYLGAIVTGARLADATFEASPNAIDMAGATSSRSPPPPR